jgi:hypothetical protein
MNHEALLYKAMEAGRKAGLECRPVPMIVGNDDGRGGIDLSRPIYHVDDGACGFAWVSVPGNSSFGRWLKASGHGRPGYPRGIWYWVSEFGQSVERKEAMANAMARVLREAGVEAFANSRLD